MLAPICLFVYNRLYHTQKTLEALKSNRLANQSDLFIYSDGPKNVEHTDIIHKLRSYLKTVQGFKSITIIEREKNYGLAENIIDGVTTIVNKYNKIIVLEDDLVTSPYFLTYMNEYLHIYNNEPQVASIHGYVYPLKKAKQLPETFFIKGADCWGWATWKRAWDFFEKDGSRLLYILEKEKLQKSFNFNNTYPYTRMLQEQIQGLNNSWAIRWYASAFIHNMLTLYPRYSLVQNIGMDNSGVHCENNDFYNSPLTDYISIYKQQVVESSEGKKAFIKYFKHLRIQNRIRKLIFFKLGK